MKHEKTAPSLREWFELPPVQVQKTSAHLDWHGANLEIAKLSPVFETQLGPIPEDIVINMILAGQTKLFSNLKYLGLTLEGKQYRPGTINLIPRQLQTNGTWDSHFTAGFWIMSYPVMQALAGQIAWGDPQQIEIYPNFKFNDPLLQHLLSAMVGELEHGGQFGNAYVDSLTQTVMLHLLKHYSSATRVRLPQKSTLSIEQKRLIEDYIEAHLASKLMIADLARLLHISVPHLERCFRANYGMPVYRYIIQRRIERAKILLMDKQKSLYDVALECGFANQSHFNHHFKASVGITPRQFIQAR